MSEQLGEALLVLRTDDRGLTAGVEAARAKGEALGRSLDNTSAAAGNLGKSLGAAGSAAAGVGHQLDSASGSATKLTQQLTQSARASEQVVAGHTRMSASGMMVMHSVRAVSDSIAVGLPITMILTEQMGRLSEAAALAGGGSGALGRLGAFMGGPWGLAVMVAVSALGQLVSRMDLFENKLVENARLLDKVKAADDGLSDAQSALGEMFDLTTGKLEKQNAVIRANIALKAAQLRADAIADREQGREATEKAGQRSWGRFLSDFARMPSATAMMFAGASRGTEERRWLEAVRANPMLGADAIRWSENHSFDSTNISRSDFAQAVIHITGAPAKDAVADAMTKSLTTGELSPMFRSEAAGRRGRAPVDRTVDQDSAYGAAYAQALAEAARIARANLTDLEEIGRLQKEEVDQQQAKLEAETTRLAAQKHWDATDTEALITQQKANAEAKKAAIDQETRRKIADKALEFDQAVRTSQDDLYRLQLGLAKTTAERRLIALSLLDNDYREKKLADQKLLNDQKIDQTEFDRRQAAYAAQKPLAERALANQYRGPLEGYLAGLNDDRARRGEVVEGLVVSELDYVSQSIDNAITSRLGIKDPLLAGLIDLFIKDVLINPIARALQQASQSGGGGLFGSLLGGLFGGGVSGSEVARLSGDAAATAANPLFAGMFADGGLIPDGGFGIVGERGPEAIFATNGGVGVMPNSALRGVMGGAPGAIHVTVSGARGNAEIEAMVRSGVAQGIAAYDPQVAERVQDHLMRRA